MKPFYCRIGCKTNLAETLISLFPKHTKYVEPFFGSGAVFFKKEKTLEIINDIDSELMNAYKLIKDVDIDIDKMKYLDTIEKVKEFYDKYDKIAKKDINNFMHNYKHNALRYYIIKYSSGFSAKPVRTTKNIYI